MAHNPPCISRQASYVNPIAMCVSLVRRRKHTASAQPGSDAPSVPCRFAFLREQPGAGVRRSGAHSSRVAGTACPYQPTHPRDFPSTALPVTRRVRGRGCAPRISSAIGSSFPAEHGISPSTPFLTKRTHLFGVPPRNPPQSNPIAKPFETHSFTTNQFHYPDLASHLTLLLPCLCSAEYECPAGYGRRAGDEGG